MYAMYICNVCMYVMYICMYVCVYMYVCMYVHVCVCVYKHACVYVHACMCVLLFASASISDDFSRFNKVFTTSSYPRLRTKQALHVIFQNNTR